MMEKEVELLRGNFWIIPDLKVLELNFMFLSEFFEIGVEEYFDEERERFRRFIVLKKKEKFLGYQ